MKASAIAREVFQDKDKILEFLIDRALKVYEGYRNTVDNANECRVHPQASLDAIREAADQVWEIMRDAYSQGADFVYTDPKKRRELRQALRLLNFAARVVSDLLKESNQVFLHHKGQNSWHAHLDTAMQAHYVAERIVALVTPGPKTYKHPQFAKWHGLNARSKRRIATIWSEAARVDEQLTKTGVVASEEAA